MINKKFEVGDTVRFVNLTSNLNYSLNGYIGNILGNIVGKSLGGYTNIYIVSTNKAHIDHKTDQLAVVIPESNLQKVYFTGDSE